MKKFLGILLAAMLIFSFGCRGEGTETAVRVVVPDGAPALSIANIMKEKSVGDRETEVTIGVGQTDVVVGRVKSGEADLAIMPTNAAVALAKQGIGIELVTVNSDGLLYLMGKDSGVTEMSDLAGKVVKVIGEGQIPDLVFQYILKQNGLEVVKSDTAQAGKVALSYVTLGTEIVGGMKAGKVELGLLPEPVATNSIKAAGTAQIFDIQAEWKRAAETENGYPMSCLVVQKKFLEDEANVAYLKAFVEKMEENLTYVAQNTVEVVETMKGYESAAITALTAESVGRMNMTVVRADAAKTGVTAFCTKVGLPALVEGFFCSVLD